MNISVIEQKYEAALHGLNNNKKKIFGCDKPVLTEGGDYHGIWLECGPLEGLVYGRIEPAVATANHEVFFCNQRADGYIPYCVNGTRTFSAQIQMVIPIAATALETAVLTSSDAFLAQAYNSCARWDEWLVLHRNTRGTGLCEAFCEFDTGHDNSPRFKGLPRKCPGEDAAVCPDAGKLPYLSPDLSASVYGGRIALAQMARHLGRNSEADRWLEKAEILRQLIIRYCYDREAECFYDVDADGDFVRITGDVLTRVLGEHVVDQTMFERIYARHIKNPAEFWAPYPLPSIALNDPLFDHNLPLNSWGGASQALTALRAPRWFEYYGKHEDLKHLMSRWVEAITAASEFMQQMNPWTGEFSTSAGYSPAMCVLIDFVDRLGILDSRPEVQGNNH